MQLVVPDGEDERRWESRPNFNLSSPVASSSFAVHLDADIQDFPALPEHTRPIPATQHLNEATMETAPADGAPPHGGPTNGSWSATELKQKPTVSEIISSITEHQNTGLLTPLTQQAAADLLEQALRAQAKGKTDDLKLAAGWKALQRLAEKGQEISDTAHLLNMADWAKLVLGCVNFQPVAVATAHKKVLNTKFKAQGFTGTGLDRLTNLHSSWTELTKDRLNGMLCVKLDEELVLIRRWREDGMHPCDTPFTPFFERVDFICKSKHIDPLIYYRLARLYDQRNQTAHSSTPEAAEFFSDEWKTKSAIEGVKWTDMREALRTKKQEINASMTSGSISTAHGSDLLALIDLNWGRYCEGASWTADNIDLTDHAKAWFQTQVVTSKKEKNASETSEGASKPEEQVAKQKEAKAAAKGKPNLVLKGTFEPGTWYYEL